MNEGLNLPRLQSLNDWMITKDDISSMSESQLIDVVKDQKVKVMITDGQVSTVLISPDLYNTFVSTVEKLAASGGASI
ncbi:MULTISPECIES: hypothetical protein [unclassified Adlercreutzia]|uniref:hypothetical protein n=1 Tax=unclassified Adlercreutzia TaxID=2636013 RepID=UPI0013ECB4A6|nr:MULTISPECIES: hypothetical protein [unclassified Adlercreutzia]